MENLKKLIASDLQINSRSVTLKPSDTGASSKKYYLLAGINDERMNELFILMQAPADTLSDFVEITNYFKRHNIRTPNIVHYNEIHGYIILEYCGNQTLQILSPNASRETMNNYYEQAIELLLTLQTLPQDPSCIVFKRFFDNEKFRFEHDFHLCQELISNYFGHALSNSEKKTLDQFYEIVSHELSNQTPVFVHRDFQSSNLIFKKKELVVVDFQDARMGPALYDLVSLIEDVYVTLQPDQKTSCVNFYKTSATLKHIPIPSENNFSWIYDLITIQRKLHDAGAFAFCFENFGNIKYLPYIKSVFQHALDVMSRYAIFNRTYDLLTMISHANLTKK